MADEHSTSPMCITREWRTPSTQFLATEMLAAHAEVHAELGMTTDVTLQVRCPCCVQPPEPASVSE